MPNLVEKNLKKRYLETNNNVYKDVNMWNDPVGAPPPFMYYTLNVLQSIDEKETVGFNIPDFHKRQVRGDLLPMTPFQQWTREGHTEGYKDQYNTTNTHIYAELPTGYLLKQGWILTKDEVLAYAPPLDLTYAMEAAAKIYNQGWDALTFTAEFKESVSLFRSIARTILKNSDLPRNWRALTCAYLSVRYGLRPILADIKSLNQAVALLKQKRDRFSDRAGYKLTTTESSYTETSTSWYVEEETINDTIVVSQRGSVVADIEIPELQVNLLQTGWELIPYSFVVDWFLNVGKALAAVAFIARAKDYSACTGYRVEVERTFHSTNGAPGSIYKSGGYEQTGYCKGTYEVRKPCSIPIIPQWVVRMNAYKVADLIALILQRLPK